MIDTIIFDLDGVLITSKNIHFESLNRALVENKIRYQISYEDHLKSFDGLPTVKKLEILNRKKLVESGHKPAAEKTFYKYYKRFMLKRKRLDRVGANWKNRAMKTIGVKAWGERRDIPVFAKESFNKRWKNRN